MTVKELVIKTLADEAPIFERVIKAIPETHRDWKPDPKSKTAIELAATIAGETKILIAFLDKGEFDFANFTRPDDKEPDEIAAVAVAGLRETKEFAEKMTEEQWNAEARMLMGGKEVGWNQPRGLMLYGMMLDIIHHRGQLSTYLRAMGGKVPSIYGPSADEPEM